MENNIDYEKKYKKLIIALSFTIPTAVALLFGIKIKGVNFSFLPPIYAGINGITALVLIFSLIAIKNKKVGLHKSLNTIAVILSCAFLVMYVLYHITTEETKFGGHGNIRFVYFIVLITHIVLSIAVIPLVLFTFVKGLSMNISSHKKLARITYPLWLYVAISGVVVYLMISPYY